MLQQNITIVSDLLTRINASVSDDLQTIVTFDGTANGSTVMDIYARLENVSMTISNLNTSAHDIFQTLQQTLVKANGLQNDFDIANSNITESLMCINEATQMLPVADSLIHNATMLNYDNKERLSMLCAEIPVLQDDLQDQLDRVQRYETQLNSTHLNAIALSDSLTQSEQELLNSSIIINHLYNYSNISLDLIANTTVALQELNVRNVVINIVH